MRLYEAVNGHVGASYVRSYIWAADDIQAQRLAERAFGRGNVRELTQLFDAKSEASGFATQPNDEGWVVSPVIREE
jgi:hypothetical protein